MVSFVVDTAKHAGAKQIVLVVGKQKDKIKKYFGRTVQYAVQPKPIGTGDAAFHGIKKVHKNSILVLNGDIPLLHSETLQNLVELHQKKKADLSFLSCSMKNPFGYGRVLRDKGKNVLGIVEHRDATTPQKKIKEINAGVYYGRKKVLLDALKNISSDNDQKELYLTDVVRLLLKQKKRVIGMQIHDECQIQGINTKAQLAAVREIVKKQWFNILMEQGVLIEDPVTINIDLSVKIGKDVRIRPHTLIEGNTRIKDHATIGPYAWIKNNKKRSVLKHA